MRTESAPPEAGPTLPEGRYGRSRRRTGTPTKRWQRVLAGAAAVAFGGVLTYVAYQNLGSTPIEAQRLGFAEQPGPAPAMSITIDVTRDEPAKPGVCIVRVRDISGAESGRREVYVPPGETSTVITSVVQSMTRPVTADVFGCSYSVPEYLSRP
ncbi:DUF4307 domain-containing protein [Amycolatopsis suaedae]|uniref:DUF4307 domain-containing protein n=1 Tax=Amycolatopsis suaedae TaxID=2510978 RepID=A0A4Q7J9E1_9PSEU|nr:DUF4307 domain-containing protein [Amycolatopsis suaedae]RZQ63546.1 DUF4307 domain-containing protein [Amycolatopsis suaedae]